MNRAEVIKTIQENGLETTYKKEMSEANRYELESMYFGLLESEDFKERHFSYSQLSMYQRCGLQYFYRYIMGIKLPPEGPQVRGHALHGTWEVEGNEKKKSGSMMSISDKREIYHMKFDEASENAKFTEEEPKDMVLKSGETVIPVHHYATEKELIIDVELEVNKMIDGNTVTGFVDKITDTGIKDMKVKGKKMSAQESMGLQLPTYTWFTGISETEYQVFTVTKKPDFQTIARLITEKDVTRAVNKMKLMIDGIEKRVFIPCDPGNWMCSKDWCGYYDMCGEEVLDV